MSDSDLSVMPSDWCGPAHFHLRQANTGKPWALGRDEEKMAVVIQRIAGREYGGFWFPRLSGTAQSLNYYPVGPMDREDGASRIAVGLGRSVVEGDRGFLFCPRYPTVPWGTEEDRWREGQNVFLGPSMRSKQDEIHRSCQGGGQYPAAPEYSRGRESPSAWSHGVNLGFHRSPFGGWF